MLSYWNLGTLVFLRGLGYRQRGALGAELGNQGIAFSRGSVYELSPSEPRCRLLLAVDSKNRPTTSHLVGVVLIPTRLRAVVDRYYHDVDPGPLVHECPARGDGIVFLEGNELENFRCIGTMHIQEKFFETHFRDIQQELQNQPRETLLLD